MSMIRFDLHRLIYNSFQIEIPIDVWALFVEALVKLRPHLWSCVSKLAHLFDILSSPSKLKTRQFKIELVIDDEIRDVALGSTLLINAFDYVDEGKN